MAARVTFANYEPEPTDIDPEAPAIQTSGVLVRAHSYQGDESDDPSPAMTLTYAGDDPDQPDAPMPFTYQAIENESPSPVMPLSYQGDETDEPFAVVALVYREK